MRRKPAAVAVDHLYRGDKRLTARDPNIAFAVDLSVCAADSCQKTFPIGQKFGKSANSG